MKFPELSDRGNQDAIHLIERYKSRLIKVAEESIGELYVNLAPHIATDAWTNYKEQCRISLYHQYVNIETASQEDAWAMMVRESIFVQFREQLETGLIADLKKRIKNLEEMLDQRTYR